MRTKWIGGLAGLALLIGGAAVRLAGAQAAPTMLCCNPNAATCTQPSAGQCQDPARDVRVSFSGMGSNPAVKIQKTEPAEGFTGACLVQSPTYKPQLPTICYSPTGAKYGAGATSTEFAIAAGSVYSPYSSLPAQYDSFAPLMTCYPHNADKSCPSGTYATSRSCCDSPMRMRCVDGIFSGGGSGRPSSWDGYYARGPVHLSF